MNGGEERAGKVGGWKRRDEWQEKRVCVMVRRKRKRTNGGEVKEEEEKTRVEKIVC